MYWHLASGIWQASDFRFLHTCVMYGVWSTLLQSGMLYAGIRNQDAGLKYLVLYYLLSFALGLGVFKEHFYGMLL